MISTRFAPSPTGFLHCGNVRTALFSVLMSLREKGRFVLRIEDTDQSRSTVEMSHAMLNDLKWLGIHWNEGPHYQSERQAVYADFYRVIEEKKRAYPCFCSDQTLKVQRKLQLARGEPPRYAGTCRDLSPDEILERLQQGHKPALRFRVPEGLSIDFHDLVKGPQHFDSDIVGDFIIRRADGTSPFLFCNAIDDALMEITHVLRGEDHLANTPRQMMILHTLSLSPPIYGHLPLILAEGGAPLSKREGSFSVHDLRQQGYLPIAILNYLARLGCTFESNDLMTLDALAMAFRPERLGRAPAHFDVNQLLHWQKLAVLALTDSELQQWLGSTLPAGVKPESRDRFLEVMQQNIVFPKEAHEWAEIFWGGTLHFSDEQRAILKDAGKAFFKSLRHGLSAGDLPSACRAAGKAQNVNGKKLYLPVRIALTGRQDGPELAQIAALLGDEALLRRLDDALEVAAC